MKNFNLSTSNVFDERFEKFIKSRRAAKLEQKFKDRTFDERTKKFALVALILSAGCTLFSAFSAHFYLLNVFNALGSLTISIILTTIVIGCLEYGKRDTLPQFFKNWFQYKSFDTVNFSISFALMALSVGSSFLGSKLIPSQLAPNPALVSADSITEHYNQLKLANEQETTAYFEANNWKGRLDGTSRPTYNKLLNEKITLDNDLKIALSEAKTDNQTIITKHEQSLAKQGVQLGYITLFSECLLILLIGFRELRDFRAISEFANIKNYESDNVKTEIVKATSSEDKSRKHENSEVRKHSKKPSEPTQSSTELKDTGINVTLLKGVVQCKHCKVDYVKNHHKQKYCNETCRKEAYEMRTGKKLYL